MPAKDKTRILFLCTGNSCRSQMAEALVNRLRGGDMEAFSAGVAPHGLDPRASKAMAEIGMDISSQESKDVSQFLGRDFDWVVTLCDNANQNCPFFPGQVRRAHAPFEDPPILAAGAKSEEEAMGHYRRIRDQIAEMVRGLPDSLNQFAI